MKYNLKNVAVTSYTTHSTSAGAGAGKSIQVIAPRDTFRQGERIPKLKLQDAKGQTVALELAHVVQQKAGVGRTASGAPVEEVTISYHTIERDP